MNRAEVERMQVMCRLGMSRAIVVPLMSAFQMDEELSLEARRFLAGPVVVHESAWNDTRPRWLEDEIAAERVGIVFGLTPDLIVGPAEIAAVMYGAMLDAPRGRDYTELYLWAAARAASVFRGIPLEKVLGNSMGLEPITDAMVLLPRARLHETYRQVASDIRRRVVTAQEARERGERREAKAEAKAEAAAAPVKKPAFVRQDLFDLLKQGG